MYNNNHSSNKFLKLDFENVYKVIYEFMNIE